MNALLKICVFAALLAVVLAKPGFGYGSYYSAPLRYSYSVPVSYSYSAPIAYSAPVSYYSAPAYSYSYPVRSYGSAYASASAYAGASSW